MVIPGDPTRVEEDSSGAAGTARGRTSTSVLVSVAWTRWRLGSVKPAEESTFSWTGEGLRGDGMAKIDTPCKSDSITKAAGASQKATWESGGAAGRTELPPAWSWGFVLF